MYIYWRIQQDLNCMGEVIKFHDPSFIRCYLQWLERHAAAISMAENCNLEQWPQPSLN